MSHELFVGLMIALGASLFSAGLGMLGWFALSLQRCTIAIVELNFNLKELSKKVEIVPRLEKDVNALHHKFRQRDGINGKIAGGD